MGIDVLILNGFTKGPGCFPLEGGASRGARAGAEWQLVDPVTGGIYRVVNVERVEYTQVLAQVREGADRPVSVLLVNPAATATTGRVLFFGPDGSTRHAGCRRAARHT